jgi:hypothetical protein
MKVFPLYEGGDYHYYHHLDPRGNLSGILPYLDRFWGRVSPSYQNYKELRSLGSHFRFLKLSWAKGAIKPRQPR